MDELIQGIIDCIVELNLNGVESAVNHAISAGATPNEIITKGISQGAKEVGKRYEKSVYFLPELVMAGEVIKAVMRNLEPHMAGQEETAPKRVFVIGTVEGDIHDIGKNLVIIFLRGHGYQVHDLGVDVPAERYVEAVKETKALALGLSALLTTTLPEMKNVIQGLRAAGLRERVKVLVGGAPVDESFARSIGADAYCKDASRVTSVLSDLLGEGD